MTSTMTLEKATLPVPQFDQIQLDQLKQDIEKSIHAGQAFLNHLEQAPQDFASQRKTIEQLDTLENQMSESWGYFHI